MKLAPMMCFYRSLRKFKISTSKMGGSFFLFRDPSECHLQQELHTNGKDVSVCTVLPWGQSPPAGWVLKLFSILRRDQGTQRLKSILKRK